MAKPTPAPLPADSRVGPYRIVRFMASGGSSLVYEAQAPGGEAVLLKEFLPPTLMHRPAGQYAPMVRPGKLPQVRQSLYAFLDGARNLAPLQHPALAAVIDCVQAHETVYLVLRYLEGHTLQACIVAARLQRSPHGGCLSEATVLSVGLDLLQAVQAVHRAGLLHLDIKPANVLITVDNAVVLLDFDAAQPWQPTSLWAGAGQDPRSRAAFTPGFSAPETMAHAAALGPWTDLYAVGACLYACMLGHPPQDSLSRAQGDTVDSSLQAVRGAYSATLIESVRSCLFLGASQRMQDAAPLQEALLRAAQSVLDEPDADLPT